MYLRTLWTMSLSGKYFTPDDTEPGEELVFSLVCGMRRAPIYLCLKNVRMCRNTAMASRSEKCQHWLVRSKSSPPTASSKAR